MTREEKAKIYDDNIRKVEYYQRENSRLKAEYVTNIPPQVEKKINENLKIIAKIVSETNKLF